VTIVELDGSRAVFDLAPGANDQDVLRVALSRGPVHAFAPVRPSLAEIFREVSQ
jgi:ABC-2 type transport system ATP-binding protein